MKKTLMIALVALVLVIVLPVTAQNMTMIDMGLGAQQDVLIYSGGILQGQYNTSSENITLPTQDFQVVVKPAVGNVLEDPGTFLADLFNFSNANVIPLMFIGFFIGLIIRGVL